MDEAFDRLTIVQKDNINKQMFQIAYACVVKSKGDEEELRVIIQKETERDPHIASDLERYCRLVLSVK